MAFDSGVATPPTSAYGPPQVDMSWIGDLLNKYSQGQQQKFAKQQRDLVTQQQQAFKNGVPVDAQGNPDYRAITQMLAQKGDINAISQLAPFVQVQNNGQVSPVTAQLLGLPAQGNAAPQVQAAPNGAPAPVSVPARPTAPAQGGGDQAGSLTDIVSAKISDPQQAGPVIARIQQTMGIDPNAGLTPGQQRRVAGLLTRYASTDTRQPGGSGTAAPAGSATARVDQSFSAFPPSAGASTPAPQQRPRPAQPAPQQTAQVQPQQPAQPTAGQSSANTGALPVEPLSPGFNDAAKNVAALEAAALQTRNPMERQLLLEKANRILETRKPQSLGGAQTIFDPASGRILLQGPQAAAMANTEPSPTLDADAERYRQTGQLPPNMGRGVQGQQQATAIRTRATELEIASGGNPADWPKQWQQFKAQQVAIQRFQSGPQGNTVRSFNVLVDHLGTLNDAAAALKNGDVRLFNRLAQGYAAQTGDPAPTNFDGVKALVGDEIVKAVVGSAGALADREEVKKDLDRASSPAQLAGLVEKYKKLALGQLHGLQKQYEVSTGLKNFDDMLLPTTRDFLQGQGSAAAETGNHPAPPSGFQLVK